jgi:hypothetical protein
MSAVFVFVAVVFCVLLTTVYLFGCSEFVNFVIIFICPFSFDHCIVCPFDIHVLLYIVFLCVCVCDISIFIICIMKHHKKI